MLFNVPIILSGVIVEYHPFSSKDQSRLHLFGLKVMPSIILCYLTRDRPERGEEQETPTQLQETHTVMMKKGEMKSENSFVVITYTSRFDDLWSDMWTRVSEAKKSEAKMVYRETKNAIQTS